MKKSLFLSLIIFLVSFAVQAQSVDELMAKHYEALGGLEKLKSLNTILHEGTFSMPEANMELQLTIKKKRPDLFISEINFQGQKMIQAYDGEKAWMLNPMMGMMEPTVLEGVQAEQIKRQADFDGDLVGYKEKGVTVELVGEEKFDGIPALKIKSTREGGDVVNYYFDKDTYLILGTSNKMETQGQEMEVVVKFADYKEIEGLFYPHTLEIMGMQNTTFTFNNIQFNVEFPDSDFQMPTQN